MKKLYSIIVAFMLVVAIVLPAKVEATQVFSDVPVTHANYGDIMYLLDKGVIKTASKYGVNEVVTREEVAVMVAKAVGLDGATPTDTKFSDVKKSNKNSGYIQAAVNAGIVNGYGDNTFKPNQKVTRGHMAAFIARAFELPAGNKTFKDVPANHTAYEAVKKLAAANITTGYGDGTFKPENSLTRAHISAFLARAMRYQTEPVEEAGNYILDPRMRELVSDLGYVKSNITKEDSYYDISKKSVEPLLGAESLGSIDLCFFYNTFVICTDIWPYQGDISGNGEVSAIIIYPNGSLTVSDLTEKLNANIEINYVYEDGPEEGYFGYHIYKDQYYYMKFEGNSPDSAIERILIKNGM